MAACMTPICRPKKIFDASGTKWRCRAFNRAWNTDVHLLPINWRPVSNGFVSWSRRRTAGGHRASGGVIAQQQEWLAAYQEQLAKAAEQLRFFKRAMFGQRRERYAPSPDQKLLFVPEVVEGLDAKQQNTQDANADSPPPRTRRKPRRPRIEFPQFWEHRRTEYPLPPDGIALRLLWSPADHHPHPRHEAGGDGRGEAVRGRRGAVHLRLFALSRRLADADHRRGRRRPWRRAPSGRASWLGW